MLRKIRSRTGILASGLAVWALAHAHGATAPRPELSAPTLGTPSSTSSALFGEPRPEVPLDLSPCAACRTAARTTGRLPADALEIEVQLQERGILLHVTSKRAEARDVVWKATLARGELLAGLRAGSPIELCESCRSSLESFRDLRITARRSSEGVVLVYSSNSDAVVRTLHELAGPYSRAVQF